jgi:Lipocalin-like domain
MKKLIVLTSVLMVIFSCKKEKNPPPPCITNAASVSGSYKITAYTYKQNASSPEIDYYKTLFPDSCDRDNVLKFNADGTYQIIDAGLVCSPAGGDNGTWSLAGNTIQIDGTAIAIESFDCKKLVLVNPDMLFAGDKLKITFIK